LEWTGVRQHPARDQLTQNELMKGLSHQLRLVAEAELFLRQTQLHSPDSGAGYWGDRLREIKNVYRAPKGFWPWPAQAAGLCIAGFAFRNRDDLSSKVGHENLPSDRAMLAAFAAVEIFESPLRFLSAELTTAFLNTEVPESAAWSSPPLPSMLISVPVGAINLLHGKGPKSSGVTLIGTLPCSDIKDCVDVFWLHESGAPASMTVPFSSAEWNRVRAAASVSGMDPEAVKTKFEGLSAIRKIVLHCWLTMAHRPDLVTEEAPLPPSGRGFARRNETPGPRSVIWIGKDFKPRSRARTAADDRDGAPVSTHWRRGHWHTVRHGSKREERRLQWYEPILVNAAA
jgi:hypothetical protein